MSFSASDMVTDLVGVADDYYDSYEYSEEELGEEPSLRRSINIIEQYDLHSSRDGVSVEQKASVKSCSAKEEIEALCSCRTGCIPDYEKSTVAVPIYAYSRIDATPALVLRCTIDPPNAAVFEHVTSSSHLTPHIDEIVHVLNSRCDRDTPVKTILPVAQTFVDIHQEVADRIEAARSRQKSRELTAMLDRLESEQKQREKEKRQDVSETPEEDNAEEGDSEESSSEDSFDAMERAPTFVYGYHKQSANSRGVLKLKKLCIAALGDCLTMYEGFQDLPMRIRANVFQYLIESESLSSKKLALLVGKDNLKLNLTKATRVADHYLEVLTQCPKLQKLDLRGCKRLMELDRLGCLHKLQELDVYRTGLDDKGLLSIVDGCPLLIRVCVSRCTRLTGGLCALVKRCAGLVQLSANHLPNVRPGDVLGCVQYSGPAMQYFSATHCFDRPESSPVGSRYSFAFPAITRPSNLHTLNLNHNWWLDDDTLVHYFKCSFLKLRRIEVFEGTGVTNDGRSYIMALCSGLSEISFGHVQEWPSDLVSAVFSNNAITSVEIANINHLGSAQITKILRTCKTLKKLRLEDLSFNYWKVHEVLPKCQRLETLEMCLVLVGSQRHVIPAPAHGADHSAVKHLSLALRWVTDVVMVEAFLPMFPELVELSIDSADMTGAGLRQLVQTLANLKKLSISKYSEIDSPLSALLETPIAAPLVELHLTVYSLGNMFTKHTLDSITDPDVTPTHNRIKTLSLIRPMKHINLRDTNIPLILQAIAYFFPSLQVLDLTHQFRTVLSDSVRAYLPDCVHSVVCCKHDNVHLVRANGDIPNKKIINCRDWNATFKKRLGGGGSDDESSSSEELNFFALFD